MVSFGVLGPLTAENDRGPVHLKGPRHRAVLARLLVARGRVVPVSWLIDDLWDDPPAGALGAVQTFVGALRKALEPDRPPRTPSRLLVTAPPGYALRAEPGTVDAWRFESAIAGAGDLPAGDALALLDEALGMWRGPAYGEFADQDWARGEAARLGELRLLAVERRAEAALAAGRAAETVPDLEAHVAGQPLREDGWRLLALALYRSGRQGDALGVLRRAREVLRDELGLDPGQGLRELEADILAQVPHPPVPIRAKGGERSFVGRVAELGVMEAAAADVVTAGRPKLVLLSGVAGAGKTALAKVLAGRLETAGWIAAWGTSPELPGAPAAWPWTQMYDQLSTTAGAGTGWEPEEGTPAARFRRHRAIAAYLGGIAAGRPVVLVFDDLHWADEETLALLTALDTGPVLIVGTYRSTEISAGLTEALGRAARAEPVRVYLGGLGEPEVRELVRSVTGREVGEADARVVHARSGGNPFFVRELARVWESEGLHTVPAGVREVIRHRLAGLPEVVRGHLRQAAVVGQEVDLGVLVALAGDEERVLDSVESALPAGFLVEQDAGRVRFAHALVHETLYGDITRARRARWHADVAGILERTRPDEVEAIAGHCLRAEGRAGAARTARYTRAAAERAERRFAPHEAARWWRATVTALEEGDAREWLAAVMGMVRALAVSGELREARRHRGRAVEVAESVGDPVLTAKVIGAFDVPAIWTANDDPALSARLVAAAERVLGELPAGHAEERARLLVTIAMELRADGGRRGERAAREAEEIARRLGDPGLLAYALNGRYMQMFHRAGLAERRAGIGAELLELAAGRGGLVTYEVLGRLILMQARAALADVEAADAHAAAADRLAERYDLPLVGVFTTWYAALRPAMTGRADEARAACRAAAVRLTGTGMPGVEEGILPLALLCIDLTAGERPSPELGKADWGPYEPWARPLVLLGEGRREEALAAARSIPESPRDLLLEVRTCLHTRIAIEEGDRAVLERLYDALLPAEAEIAGAGSGMVTLGPVARYLGELAAALGREDVAARHYRRARAGLRLPS
ncbi:DNA-binding transcriptional activator of the SARP family [Nonomuraea solani]|uniref:DNA-binding transcriptional activator of the SARP family n=1 Tax=Nonomuraea solani TaxID=1144553 RepID=A0A1H5VGX7_9ACTN|nr:BTAD domain-containing putative transcriptional regulator [Nonomuraea solani]SEF86306.1 DNA-binding transcriptional activator of the SARP family [Nonomuraea solani]